MRMKLKIWITVLMAGLLFSACQEDRMEKDGQSFQSGKVTVELLAGRSDVIESRVTDPETEADQRIENALLFVFDTDGNCVAKQWMEMEGYTTQEIFLPSSSKYIHAICNLMDPDAVMSRVTALEDLEAEAVTLTEADEAFKGKYVMYGKSEDVSSLTEGTNVQIEVQRLASQFQVAVSFQPTSTDDQFSISKISVKSLPKGSWIVPRDVPGGTVTGGEPVYTSGNQGDWMQSFSSPAGRYFDELILSPEERVDDQSVKWQDVSFSMFENRRGSLSTATDDWAANWPDLANRTDDEKKQFAQLWKGTYAANFENATYLSIEGMYQRMGITYAAEYKVFLGADNFSDYNVERNKLYKYEVIIRAIDDMDTRIDKEDLTAMTVQASTEGLDAHCNVVKALMYASSAWEIWVEDPDEHPWLELSMSGEYHPKMVEAASSDDQAAFRLSGSEGGLRYFYIHTDEYVPQVESPSANNSLPVRTGRIAYRKQGSTDEPSYLTVTQYPAQMVVLHIGYDVHTMKEVRDTFYVERILERKHMGWGFYHYWSFITDDLIASGQWDGLSNTRKLYDVAVNGDKWGVESAYEKNTDGIWVGRKDKEQLNGMALGYILEKNRDRNGNGEIDYNEIMWYMPAAKELQALSEALDENHVVFSGSDDYFHSSTPSAADPAGVTPGFSYYVRMTDGKKGVGRRDRDYNVIACRRKNAWKGPQTGEVGGSVNDAGEMEDEEVIMPKK